MIEHCLKGLRSTEMSVGEHCQDRSHPSPEPVEQPGLRRCIGIQGAAGAVTVGAGGHQLVQVGLNECGQRGHERRVEGLFEAGGSEQVPESPRRVRTLLLLGKMESWQARRRGTRLS